MERSVCERCGQELTRPVRLCWLCERLVRLEAMPADVMRTIDPLIVDRKFIQAIIAFRRHDPTLGLSDAEVMTFARGEALGVPRYLPDLDVDTLARRIEAISGTPIALEAYWDGDTDGWIALLAVVTRDGDTVRVSEIGGLRGAKGILPGERARAYGDALSMRFGIAFHFPNESSPDFDAPRWSDSVVKGGGGDA